MSVCIQLMSPLYLAITLDQTYYWNPLCTAHQLILLA